jgi:hypothetical protein
MTEDKYAATGPALRCTNDGNAVLRLDVVALCAALSAPSQVVIALTSDA